MNRFVPAIAVLAAAVSIAQAQPANPVLPPLDCSKAVTVGEITACAERDFRVVDAAIKGAYDKALRLIETNASLGVAQRRDWKRALQEAQRKWLAYREADCGAPIGWEWYDRDGLGAATLMCKIARTEDRLRALEQRYGT